MNSEEIKQTFEEYVDSWTNETLLKSIEGATLGVLNKACGSTERRHSFLKALTGHSSSRELNSAQMWALYRLVQPDKIGGHWTTQRGEMELEQICNVMISSLDAQPGQLTLEEYFESLPVVIDNEPVVEEKFKDNHLSFDDDLTGYEPPF